MNNLTMEEMSQLTQKVYKENIELRKEVNTLKNELDEVKKKVAALIDEKNI